MGHPAHSPPDSAAPGLVSALPAERPGLLLAVAQAVAAHADLRLLFRNLADALDRHVLVDYLSFSLVDPATRVAQFQLLQPVGSATAPDVADMPAQLPGRESPTATVWESQTPFWLAPGEPVQTFPVLAAALRRQGVRAACFVPLSTPRRQLGAMAFSCYRPVALGEGDLDFLTNVGRLVALAVEATLARRELEEANAQLTSERDRLETVLRVGEAASSRLDLAGLITAVASTFRRLVGQELTTLWLPDPDGRHLRAAALELVGQGKPDAEDLTISRENSPAGEAFRAGTIVRLGPSELRRLTTPAARALAARGGGSYCAVPLHVGGEVVAVLSLLAARADAFPDAVVELLAEAARPVGVAVANALAYRRIEHLTARLAQEKLYLEEEIRTEGRFDEVIGDGPALRKVLQEVEVVAPTDSTVLITGETGTGKELVARAVHRLSQRRGRTFVKLNCAAIPTGLLESELFGHEKGAFTGAVERRIGRFELADGGTLFLDEVGDIPLELQPKLLRVLQEQEFERLGSARTVKVNVRLVAATHRDLSRLVASGAFRSDLYYRLCVFPIRLPALRERREDVAALVRHFALGFARRIGKVIDVIPEETMAALQKYDWPGNVRELEHLVERAVILSPGRELRVPQGDLALLARGVNFSASPHTSRNALQDAERDLIVRTLEECNWVVGGPRGAAARLGMKRTTLLARMKKFGLERPQPRELSDN